MKEFIKLWLHFISILALIVMSIYGIVFPICVLAYKTWDSFVLFLLAGIWVFVTISLAMTLFDMSKR